jgi:hypothetical protein
VPFILTALFFYGRSLRTYDDLTPLRMLLPAAGFALSLTLAMLVKVTTALSVFLLISCHLLWHLLRRSTEVGAFYWTDMAPDIVNPGREEQGSVSV